MTSTTPMNEPHGYKDPKTHKQDWNNPGKPKIKFDKKVWWNDYLNQDINTIGMNLHPMISKSLIRSIRKTP
jgi:hypothetical protein